MRLFGLSSTHGIIFAMISVITGELFMKSLSMLNLFLVVFLAFSLSARASEPQTGELKPGEPLAQVTGNTPVYTSIEDLLSDPQFDPEGGENSETGSSMCQLPDLEAVSDETSKPVEEGFSGCSENSAPAAPSAPAAK